MKKITELENLKAALKIAQDKYNKKREHIVKTFKNHQKHIQETLDAELGKNVFKAETRFTCSDSFEVSISWSNTTGELRNYDKFVMSIKSDGINIAVHTDPDSNGRLSLPMHVLNKISDDIFKTFNQ